jgi:hypothetical protein
MNNSASFSTTSAYKSTLRKGTVKPTKDYKALIAEDEVMRNYSSTVQSGLDVPKNKKGQDRSMLRPKSASAIRKSAPSAFPPANHLPNKAIPYNSHQFGAEKPLSHLDAIANRYSTERKDN